MRACYIELEMENSDILEVTKNLVSHRIFKKDDCRNL